MKLLKYIFFLILLTVLSCDQWLELVPPNGLVQDEYWKTKAAGRDVAALVEFAEANADAFWRAATQGGI